MAGSNEEAARLRVHMNNKEENLSEQAKAKERGFTYENNSVTTSKYTFYNFLVLNLTQQFTRLANIYFLVIALLQLFTPLSPTGRYSTAAPLALVRFSAHIYECVLK
jgi:magnesium-transporting ATPase (P-type)